MDKKIVLDILQVIQPFLIPIIPTIILIFGGQWIIDKYAIRKKKRETEIDLINSIRKQQYETLSLLYNLFAKFMELYRLINSDLTKLSEESVRKKLLATIIKAESQIDALILKIGCEFVDNDGNQIEIENMLGNLRQSVQLWRERVLNGEKLPFNNSSQPDYLRFKTAFSHVSAFMINKIHNKLEAPKVKMEFVKDILVGSFDNKHEKWNLGNPDKKKEYKKYYDPKIEDEENCT
jgi:hypothetical protein